MKSSFPSIIDAVFRKDVDAVRRALKSGAPVDARDPHGRTALHHAAIAGNEEMADVLIAASAGLDAQDHNGWTPLHFAASEFQPALVAKLLDRGASLELEDAFGNTPLWRAVMQSRGRGEVIRLLVERGADTLHCNKSGVSPASLATTIANYDIAEWLAPRTHK